MKKLISVLLILAVIFALGVSAFAAANEPDGHAGEASVEELPGSIDLNVYVTVLGGWPYQDDDLSDGGDVTGPGFEAHVESGIPEVAIRLVIVPITDPDALAWFDGCVGPSWASTGAFYAVFYETSDGARLPAYGVTVTVTLPADYAADGAKLDLFSLDPDGVAVRLGSSFSGRSMTFTTNGKLYYGPVHSHGAVDEVTDVGPGAPDTSLDMTPDELADAVLTDEDREYLDEGIDIHIKLTVEDITDTVSPLDVEAVESVAGGFTVGEYIDVELLKQIGDQPWENIHETKKPLRITVRLPERLLGHEQYAIARVHNGRAEFLTDLDSVHDTITFETNEFSVYAILYRDPAPTAAPTPTARPGEVPPTGDDTILAPWVLLLAVSAAGLAALAARRKKNPPSVR